MCKILLSDNEARVLRALNLHEGSYLYELASAAKLTYAAAGLAVQRLDARAYLVADMNARFVRITGSGIAARRDILRLHLDDSKLSFGRSHSVRANQEPNYVLSRKISAADLAAAIDAELSKYE